MLSSLSSSGRARANGVTAGFTHDRLPQLRRPSRSQLLLRIHEPPEQQPAQDRPVGDKRAALARLPALLLVPPFQQRRESRSHARLGVKVLPAISTSAPTALPRALGRERRTLRSRIEVIEPLLLLPYPRTACCIAVPPCYPPRRGCRPPLTPP
jgi:hypothetical protein